LPSALILGEHKLNKQENRYDWQTIKWNLFALKLFGDVRGKQLQSLLIPNSFKLISEQIHEVLKLKKEVVREFSLTLSKGMRVFDALSYISSFELGDRLFILIMLTDITELQTAKILAQETDQDRTNFLANITHEIRTPLNGILGFSNLLVNEKDPLLIKEFLEIIKRKNIELQNLISDILMLGKMDSYKLTEQIDVTDLIDTFKKKKNEYEKWIEEGQVVTINYALPYSFFKVKVDTEFFPYMFEEFVHNAIKFTAQGEIRAGIYVEEGRFTIFTYNQGNEIPLEKQILIFNRFKKLDVFKQGTGLGLSVCLAIAKWYNGQIGVYSKEGFGNLFWATIPLSGELGDINFLLEEELSTLLQERWRGIWYDKDGTEPNIGVDDGELTINPYTHHSPYKSHS